MLMADAQLAQKQSAPRLEWYEKDRDFDPEWLSLEECREIVEAFNS